MLIFQDYMRRWQKVDVVEYDVKNLTAGDYSVEYTVT